ncbi:uncharacterized protein LTR77_009156 [Saxophila tyrrhenica]|uniref:Uncharacterized protein n=1 Tax=Saxophila tyrrhenica TaxID=1690608 RepID=A0AAV9NY95_9PEZI|nr:hypothetical protein LTR77_009156 [Saxophila tyrrhenica]
MASSASAPPDDDPITASYDIYLTPQATPTTSQIYLLQYPNRHPNQPYNARAGVAPEHFRIKPTAGYLEMDTAMHTGHNFNRYQALKWGDAVRTAKEGVNGAGNAGAAPAPTYGLAAGLSGRGGRVKGSGRGFFGRGGAGAVKDEAEREMEIQDGILEFEQAKSEGRVMSTQTIGGQILKHESGAEEGKPGYFVGAFRGNELHLSRVTGTAQMRPVFHHLDAEDARVNGGQYGGAGGQGSGSKGPAERGRVVHQSYKSSNSANPRGELEEQTNAMRSALQQAAEEPWTRLEFVDEDDEAAYQVWSERMFVRDTDGLPGRCEREEGRQSDGDEKEAEAEEQRSGERGRLKKSSDGTTLLAIKTMGHAWPGR